MMGPGQPGGGQQAAPGGAARPGQMTYSSGGVGGSTHLAGELFKLLAKVDMVHVPYKGGGPAVADLVSGQVMMTFGNLTTVLPFAA